MSWKDNLRPGSFKGAAFGVDEHEADIGGLRVITHLYPKRDTPYAEENGRKAHSFSIEVFVIGADYMERRDALIAVCNESGAGTLVHPWLGSLLVYNTGCRVRESKKEGRMARFSLSFVEAGSNSQPQRKEDLAWNLDDQADRVRESAARSFAERFSLRGQPEFVRSSALEQMLAMTKSLERLPTLTGINLTPPTEIALKGQRRKADTLFDAPQELARSLLSLAGSVAREQRGSRQFIRAFSAALKAPALAPIPETTTTRKRQAANRKAMARLLERSALIETARSLPRQDIESRDDAWQLKDHFGAALDREMDLASEAGDFGIFDRLAGLRATTMRYLDDRSPELARKSTLVLPATDPALVVAYKLFGSIDRAEEITRRNKVIHPGFVPGGVELEVLRHG